MNEWNGVFPSRWETEIGRRTGSVERIVWCMGWLFEVFDDYQGLLVGFKVTFGVLYDVGVNCTIVVGCEKDGLRCTRISGK
ncbi:hypothetical protein GOBAR_AA35756 [Gossypium barbadense]|uniref:Uncharacterized protein n=1 Tax=Gossypium barbadense TaxID=3634 RepID=A0A2P5W1K6_GOSBA|nr:hypothetical protein GOBAR_AA35756 [Gossypium barbadense]